jgi:protein SCO1/2
MKWILTLAMLAAAAVAQHAPNAKSFVLKGKITDVGKDRVTINHGAVEGYMGAMTMPYKVDKAEVLAQVKTGDQIEATVYKDDYTLYNVKVVAAAAKDKSKK